MSNLRDFGLQGFRVVVLSLPAYYDDKLIGLGDRFGGIGLELIRLELIGWIIRQLRSSSASGRRPVYAS
jgi:hypothetical protein